jgi:O-methyltransferase involved in polyketide biosynthesis
MNRDVRKGIWCPPADDACEHFRVKQAARGVDASIPNVARIYDFMLGGKDNFAADRDAAAKVIQEIPHVALACRQSRDFIGRVVRLLAQAGIRQFLDIGSGLPTENNVHQIAQGTARQSRVVYVDYDPVVLTHARALLDNRTGGVLAIEGDLREPAKIISGAGDLLDFSQPVAVLLFAVLHFLTNAERPHWAVRSLAEALAPGSAVAVSHITDEETDPQKSLGVQRVYQGASAPTVPRSRQDITRFFDGLELIAPGVTDINRWPALSPGPTVPLTFYGGVGRKP